MNVLDNVIMLYSKMSACPTLQEKLSPLPFLANVAVSGFAPNEPIVGDDQTQIIVLFLRK